MGGEKEEERRLGCWHCVFTPVAEDDDGEKEGWIKIPLVFSVSYRQRGGGEKKRCSGNRQIYRCRTYQGETERRIARVDVLRKEGRAHLATMVIGSQKPSFTAELLREEERKKAERLMRDHLRPQKEKRHPTPAMVVKLHREKEEKKGRHVKISRGSKREGGKNGVIAKRLGPSSRERDYSSICTEL